MAIAELDLAPLESEALAILRQGDPDNAGAPSLRRRLGPRLPRSDMPLFSNWCRA